MKTNELTIVNVQYITDYQVKVTFNDNQTKNVDLKPYLWGEVFEPLKDKDMFKQVRCSKELGTIFWPNGADIAPEALYG